MRLRLRRPNVAVDGSSTAAEVAIDDPVDSANRLADDGRVVEAVDLLLAAYEENPTPRGERALRDLRLRAAADFVPGSGREDWPPAYPDPFPGLVGSLPEVPSDELTSEVMGGAVAHHGALIVRGAFTAEQVERAVEMIDRVRAEIDEWEIGRSSEWFDPVSAEPVQKNGILRQMVAKQGGTWLGDSPAASAFVLRELERAGIVGAIAEHLGERPFFSLQKSTLRRSLPDFFYSGWHQDGSFLSKGCRTMNAWVALTDCGGDRPCAGLEVLPERVPEILPVDGVMSKHSISYDLVAEMAEITPTVVPEFDAGDAAVFDERFLHRTHLTPGMTDLRYAIECWFFAPSHQAMDYSPLLV